MFEIKFLLQVKCRDVLTCGFGEELISKADAVFLDLPKPWLGVSWAKHAIRCDKGKTLLTPG